MARVRRRRRVFVVFVAVLLAASAAGAWLLFRPDPGRARRERAVAAAAALTEGRLDEARVMLAAALREDPDNLALRQNLTVCLLRLERFEEAGATARETIRRFPDDSHAHLVLSIAEEHAGRTREAIEEARRAVDGRNAAPAARFRLADLLAASGRTTEALAVLGEAAERIEDLSDLPLRLASLLSRADPESAAAVRARRQIDAILANARERLGRDPANPEMVRSFAQLAFEAGRPEEALAALTAVPVHRPLDRTESLLMARACSETGRHRRAAEILDGLGNAPAPGAPPDAPPDPAAAAVRGAALLRAGDAAGALGAIEPALAAAPDRPDLLLLAAQALHARWMESPADADLVRRVEEISTRILSVRPDDEAALDLRAVAHLALGRPLDALEDAAALTRLSPSSPRGPWLGGLALDDLDQPASALAMLRRGKGAAPPPAADGVLFRVAVRAGDAAGAREAFSALPSPSAALRSALLATEGKADEAEAAFSGAGDAPRPERILAAAALARTGRPAPALSLAGEDGYERERVPLLCAALPHPAALAALRAVAESGGPPAGAALPALIRLALVPGGPEGLDADALLARLREQPGSEDTVRRLDAYRALAAGRTGEAAAAADRILAGRPFDPSGREIRLLALAAKGAGREELIAAADAVLECLPAHPAARLIRARGLVERVRAGEGTPTPEDTLAALDEAVSLAPGDVPARLARAVYGVMAGDAERAEEDAIALEGRPDAPGLGSLLLGLVRARQGRFEEAEAALRRAAEESPDAPEPRLVLARLLIARDRPAEALPLARAADRDGSATSTIVSALLALRRPDEAEALARERAADRPWGRELVGRVLLARGSFEAAAAHYREFALEVPESIGPAVGLLRALVALKKVEEALAAADGLVAGGRFGPLSLLLRSRLRALAGDRPGAIRDAQAAVRDAPASGPGRRWLGELLLASGERASGMEQLRQAAALDPREVPARLRLALQAESAGQEAEAVAWYEEILRCDPGQPVAANNLAFRLAASGADPERAVELARRAVSIGPGEGEFHDTLAVALSAANRHEEAVGEAAKAMELAPESAWVAVRAAEVFLAAREWDRARAAAMAAELKAGKEEAAEIGKRTRLVIRALESR